MNLEEKLKYRMQVLEGIDLDKSVLEKIAFQHAKEIAEDAEKELKERMEVVKNVEAGNSSFGFTTALQEQKARSEYRMMFEFDCFQFSKFKTDHNIK